MAWDKDTLEEMFSSEEKIGIFYAPAYPESPDENILAYLPGDFGQMGKCTNCALYVASRIPGTVIAGFLQEENPACTHPSLWGSGHDFAIVDRRYIVDFWISLYTGDEDHSVFDCLDPKEHEKIVEIYGDPNAWKIRIDDEALGERYGQYYFPQKVSVLIPEAQEALHRMAREKLERECNDEASTSFAP